VSDGAIQHPAIRRSSVRRRFHRLDAIVSPYLYVGSFFVVFCAFGLFPLGYTAYMSMTDRNLLEPTTNFIWFDNYTKLLHDSYFWNAVENTLGIWVLSTVPQLLLALGLAHLLNTKLRARTFFRMGVLLPQVTSLVAVALIFTQLFSRDYGLINWMLGGVGIGPVNWEAGRLSSWIALSVMVTWRWAGYNALLYLAAMQAIPDDLYESAAIDGAGRWKQFWHITVPMIRPTIIFTVIISTIGGLQLFTEPYLFQPIKQGALGGSARQYQTISMYLYEKAFGSSQFDFGYAAAIAWVLFLIIVVISLINFLLVRRIRSAE
jgi:cellobiose transport system permease protein